MTDARTMLRSTILIWLLLELVAAAQVYTSDGATVLVSWLRAAVRPATWSAERLGDLAIDLSLGVRNLRHVIADNRDLRFELSQARARELLLRQDLAAAREIDGLVAAAAELETAAALARCSYRNLSTGLMEARTSEPIRIRRDTPAVTSAGLVGRVVRSDNRRHWLELLTHPAAAVAVQTEDARVHGLAVGTGGELLEIRYVPRQSALVRGTLLVTSGADGIYPAGIAVARVTRVRETENAFLEVRGVPSAELREARLVLLLPAWSPGEPGGQQ